MDENTDELKIISVAPSSVLNFYVIYAETWKDTLKYRQKLVKNLLNFTSFSGDISFANFILILDVTENPKSSKHKYWKLIVPIYQRKLESAKLNVYVIDPSEKKFRTLASNIAKVALELEGHKELSASLIRDALNNYMLVRPLTEEFFKDYRDNYYRLKDWIKKHYGAELEKRCPADYLLTVESTPIPEKKRKEIFIERAAKTFAHTFFNRLMFVYFLQKKGWIVDLDSLREELRKKVDVKNFVLSKPQYSKILLKILMAFSVEVSSSKLLRRDSIDLAFSTTSLLSLVIIMTTSILSFGPWVFVHWCF
ncbi:hypothetical protein A3L09_10620 (plasmid) [Thermococcus profundus]|uniref:Uncharacterized protein n=1 Tax=Thermococcus profundus TaxID=49899 RepID=A0A2Z2MIZ0_THEPR|nr:hypothetical protein [Thermococcus profundus]ASJ03804.1 hypothetical protein A3L09_10620 [Thermococcus profundus]